MAAAFSSPGHSIIELCVICSATAAALNVTVHGWAVPSGSPSCLTCRFSVLLWTSVIMGAKVRSPAFRCFCVIAFRTAAKQSLQYCRRKRPVGDTSPLSRVCNTMLRVFSTFQPVLTKSRCGGGILLFRTFFMAMATSAPQAGWRLPAVYSECSHFWALKLFVWIHSRRHATLSWSLCCSKKK